MNPSRSRVKRAKINVPSVAGKILDGNIGYIRLSSFGETTDKEFRKELSKLLDQKPSGLILDLRYNGGGLLSTSIEIASEFIPKGVILHERYGDGKETVYKAYSGGLATEIPLVVLVNEGVSLRLRDSRRRHPGLRAGKTGRDHHVWQRFCSRLGRA